METGKIKHMEKFIIHTDGGSRGNPGPAALGIVIEGLFNRQGLLKQALPVNGSRREYGEYIGITTNNEAEYKAVIFALKKLKQLIGNNRAEKAQVIFYMDSELLVKQLNYEYKVKEKNIQKLFLEVHNLRLDFQKVEFKHVLRSKNADADQLVNQVLDREPNKLDL